MASEISISAKLAVAVAAGTVVNVKSAAVFDSIITSALGQFDHRSTTLAASSGAKTVLPTGGVTINDAAKYFWVFIRNTSITDSVSVLIEYSSGNYATAGVLPPDASGNANGSFFLTRMVGAASTYPRVALISASSGTPVVETIVADA